MRITIKNNQSKQISTAIGLLDVGAAKTVDVSDSDATDVVSELNKLGSMVTYTIATDYTDTIAASMSLYVSATGNDASGDGTAAKPFASIQKAIDVVGDRQISGNAVINVGPGSFAGFRLDNLRFGRSQSTFGSLSIIGTMSVAQTSSINTGVIASSSLQSPLAMNVITIAAAAWAVDELKGKYIINNTLGVLKYIPIISNTSNTITTYTLTSDLADGHTITIMEPTTIITTSVGITSNLQMLTNAADATSYSGGTESNTVIRINNCAAGSCTSLVDVPSLLLANMRITSNTAGVTRMRISNSKLMLRNIITDGSSTSSQIYSINSTVQLFNWISAGSGISYNAPTSSTTSDYCSVNVGYIERSAAAGGLSGSRQLLLTDCYIKGYTAGVTCTDGFYTFIRCAFENCTNAVISKQGANYQLLYTSRIAHNYGFYNNNTIAIELKGPHWCHLKPIAGSGNTTCLSAKFGTRLGIRSDVNMLGTTEVELDTTTTTYATMRAATPKLVTNTYGTIVYESDN